MVRLQRKLGFVVFMAAGLGLVFALMPAPGAAVLLRLPWWSLPAFLGAMLVFVLFYASTEPPVLADRQASLREAEDSAGR
jgi:hypothetical protein